MTLTRAGQRVSREPTHAALDTEPACERLKPALVKARQTPVGAWRLGSAVP